ncbi:hypothetical protein TRFO_10169 [Tritrichomonas foetus]|uniref:Uncharacterized protein n=1 Tax=Tritrichomonas foetus TaxID=1144522 RepID=A0A1J4JD62_9EUKA|nr:hypothetical protein TRFO_10169 [Tritrichomonas foetus]|eukprot:OHS96215.1 hypothetical protein TRFO_10169 [Tritrichomonas foetus]
MIAASEMKNIMEMKGKSLNNKVINALKDSLNFKNEFIDKVSEELHEKIYKITEKLFAEFYMNIWKHQLSKIDLSQFEVENCLNDFFYGRIGSDFATTLSEKFINSM